MDRIHSATANSFLIKVYMWLDFVFKAYVDVNSLEGGEGVERLVINPI